VPASTYSLNPHRGIVTETDLVLTYQTTDHNGNNIKSEFQWTLDQIKGYLKNIEAAATEFNNQIEDKSEQGLTPERKSKKRPGISGIIRLPDAQTRSSFQTFVFQRLRGK
jgi:hypothetical protein